VIVMLERLFYAESCFGVDPASSFPGPLFTRKKFGPVQERRKSQ